MTKNERLKSARIKSGLSQEELANALNVKQAYIAALESEKGFSLKKAKEIGDILKIDGNLIFFGQKEDINKVIKNENNKTTNHETEIEMSKDVAYLEEINATQKELIAQLKAENSRLIKHNESLLSENETLRSKLEDAQTGSKAG